MSYHRAHSSPDLLDDLLTSPGTPGRQSLYSYQNSVRSPFLDGQWLPGRSLEEGDMPTIAPLSPTPAAADDGAESQQNGNNNNSTDKNAMNSAAVRPTNIYRHATTSNLMPTGSNHGKQRPMIRRSMTSQLKSSRIFDDPAVTAGYATVPVLEVDELPRGGVSVETAAVGRIQFGIPPETIKDSMLLGLEVPRVYIVPTERFCSDLGPALGINLAEFEFPAYFNYFVRKKKVCLVVDSKEAEMNIRNVFEETLLGPKQFRDKDNPVANNDEDFGIDFPLDARPNFYREFQYFRQAEKTADYDELQTDMLLDFHHFNKKGDEAGDGSSRNSSSSSNFSTGFAVNMNIGVPPQPRERSLSEGSAEGDHNEPHTPNTRSSSHEIIHRSIGRMSPNESDMASAARKATRFAHDTHHHHPHHHRDHSNSHKADRQKAMRRASLESVESMFSATSAVGSIESFRSDYTSTQQPWKFSQLQWLGEVATVWPMNATPEQISERSVPRVEIFKMPGSGTEYVIHDVNENNIIVGKARLKGHVHVPDEISLEGFQSSMDAADAALPEALENIHFNGNDDEDHSGSSMGISVREDWGISSPTGIRPLAAPKAPLFHPPSFGVTVLGNSHGFDKNGSTSGYVLWVNGRGIMIDPPPYSSNALEKEGIHPQMIFGVMITHCHADHDAGAFQKVLTGSRLSIITTPSIYSSFIRKYSALSGLTPALLRQSHRFRAANIGEPLKFQGATFHFTYTLHTIPCISFKVEWRGRSMVFTGDHLNLPPLLDELEEKGVLSKGRADSLRQMPLQECDALLHEAGAPPIHTPLYVLEALPDSVKQRLYVVHTSAIPADSNLRVAPVGTAATIRLDEFPDKPQCDGMSNGGISYDSWVTRNSQCGSLQSQPPKVLMRPPCISDAWFMLNLISNIPFFTNLSYVNTMEVLEVANVECFSPGEIVVADRKRHEIVCIVWEGVCEERLMVQSTDESTERGLWHAGDWSAPLALQPNKHLSSAAEPLGDIVALSEEGVKAIILDMNHLKPILMRGSKLYRNYVEIEERFLLDRKDPSTNGDVSLTVKSSGLSSRRPAAQHVLDTLKVNSILGNLFAQQLRSLESIAEGPRVFKPGSYLWKVGSSCSFAYLIASGTAYFCPPPPQVVKMMKAKDAKSSRQVLETEGGELVEVDKILYELPPESEFARLELLMQLRAERMQQDPNYRSPDRLAKNPHHKQSDRNANKVLGRLYASGKVIDGLTVSRGCFLGDTSKMVSGDLVKETGGSKFMHVHSSTLKVGPDGCIAWVFPRSAFIPFLDSNPGVLLSLLSTQVFL